MATTLDHILIHCRRIPRSQISSFFLRHCHPFSTIDSPPQNNPQPENPTPNANPVQPQPGNPIPIREPVQVQPVSYAPKPKPETETVEEDEMGRNLTREEVRYVKDAPTISTMAYPKRVAPLPEDRPEEGMIGVGVEKDEVAIEGRKIDADNRVFRRVFKVAEEEKEVPFPKMIKKEKKQSERTVYDLQDAILQVKANAKRNFDETVEAHVNLGIDRRRSDLGVSGCVVLPHGTGKIVKVAVFAEGAAAEEARAAGADVVGGDELIDQIRTSGKINFDKCIATHSMMQRVTKIGKILRGLTPNAKRGTVTNNVSVAVKEAKQGLLDFRMKDSIVHVGVGKASFSEECLRENIGAFVSALLLAKPAGLKKTSKYAGYVNSFNLCSTMGPGFPISIQSLSRAADNYTKSHMR